MESVLVLLRQIIIMFLLAGVGYLMFRAGKITLEGNKCIGNILLFLSLPCVIINGFMVERTSERVLGFAISALLAALILIMSVLVSRLFFPKDPIGSFAAAFSNPGFFGIPLVISCMNEGAVFYIAAYIAFLNMMQWSYGTALITGQKMTFRPKTLLTAPFFIAIMIGIFLFFTQLPLPEVLTKSIGFLAGLNTPLAMFAIGVYLAQTNILQMVKKKNLYKVSLVRLLVIPIAALMIIWLVPGQMYELKMAVFIATACPVGANIAVYAQLHNKNYSYAVETVVISTLWSIVSLPAMVWIMEYIIR